MSRVEGEVLVGAAETSNEVVLEDANGMLSSIMAMNTRRDQLIVDTFLTHKFLEGEGGFVV
jgi:hypothetical protein